MVRALEINKARCAATASTDSINSRLNQLTTREREVMALVLAGKLKIIASELQISMRTVEACSFDKMGVEPTVELAQTLAASPREYQRPEHLRK